MNPFFLDDYSYNDNARFETLLQINNQYENTLSNKILDSSLRHIIGNKYKEQIEAEKQLRNVAVDYRTVVQNYQ